MPKTLSPAERPRLVADPDSGQQPLRSRKSLIQWPTEDEILNISAQLFVIQRAGIACEAGGDFFKSGDLAYQMQEIIRATADLSKKIQRIKV